MPKLIFPKDMSDLEGETFEGSDIRDNMQAISDLVNVEGLDWENVEQWSLDSLHSGYVVNEPRTPMKEGFSSYGGGNVDDPSVYGANTWRVVDPPGEIFRYVEEGAGIFIIGSLIVNITMVNLAYEAGMMLETKLAGAWDWRTLWESRLDASRYQEGGTPAILGAVKATKAGQLGVRLSFRQTATHDGPVSLGYANISVFVVNR